MHIRIILLLVSVLTLLISSCDNDTSKCKNDPTFPTHSLTIRWFINGTTPDGNFSFDTCGDIDASKVKITITGPEEYLMEDEFICNSWTTLYRDNYCEQFPDGLYTVTAVLLASNGMEISTVLSETLPLSHVTTETVFDFDFTMETLPENLTGTLYLDPLWENMTCTQADPPVTNLDLAFFSEGSLVETLDYSGPCQSEVNLHDYPAGDYELRVLGYDNDTPVYCGSFDIKVGIGLNTPVDINVSKDATGCAQFNMVD